MRVGSRIRAGDLALLVVLFAAPLRTHCQPRGRRTAKKCDEFPSLHGFRPCRASGELRFITFAGAPVVHHSKFGCRWSQMGQNPNCRLTA